MPVYAAHKLPFNPTAFCERPLGPAGFRTTAAHADVGAAVSAHHTRASGGAECVMPGDRAVG